MAKKKEKEADAEVENKDDKKTPEADGAEGAEGDAVVLPAAGKSKKKLLIIVAAALLVLVGAGVFFSGILGKHDEGGATELGADGKPVEKPVFYTLPEFLVNLNSSGKQVNFLKCTVILEVAHSLDVKGVEANLPRLIDALNTYLRELRPSDLAGSAGIQRLREELLLRSNKALAPIKINDVLFKEVIVQ